MRVMNEAEKKHLMMWNTVLWLAAMVLPVILSYVFASAKFPWKILVPFLLFGCMLASNKMLAQAIGQTTSTATPKSGNA